MKSTQVKSHKRKGRVVKSHSRAVKGAKTSGSGMSAEECKAKYDAMVTKYGEDSPQAIKLAMKMESMETVEKEAKNKHARRRRVGSTPEADKPKKLTIAGRKVNAPTPDQRRLVSNFVNNWGTKKKHSRGDYMRKNVEEDLLTREAKAKKGSKVSPEIAKANQKDKLKKLFADKTVVGKKPSVEHKKAMHDKMAALRAKKK